MPSPIQPSILNPALVGVATSFGTVIVHAFLVGIIVWGFRRDLTRGRLGSRYLANLTFVAGATMLALVAHLFEIGLWAIVFQFCGEFSGFAAAFYHSAVNYTTLGYGDVEMSPQWRLLGPLEAADGVLMFGVSTALIFALMQRLIQTRLGLLER